jgi:tetratricopeptide (TPR) repeat protein
MSQLPSQPKESPRADGTDTGPQIINSWLLLLSVVALAATALSWAVGNIVSGKNLLLAVLAIFIFGDIIPALMEDMGWWLVRQRLWGPGEEILKLVHQINKTLFAYRKDHADSMPAMRLAQSALARNRLDEASKWIDEAITASERDAWLGPFYAYAVASQISYTKELWPRALFFAEKAQTIFDENIEATKFTFLRTKLRGFDLVNLAILGRLALHSDNIEGAQKYFDRSYLMRNLIANRAPLAEAFKEHAHGLIEVHRWDMTAAQNHFARALELLPVEGLHSDYNELALAIEICHDALSWGVPSDETTIMSWDKLAKLHARGLPPRLLEEAAKPIKLPQAKSN